jgi:hypothetical protein
MTARVIWGPLKYPDPHAHDPLPRGATAYDAHDAGHGTAHTPGQTAQGQAATPDRGGHGAAHGAHGSHHDETGDLTGREIAILMPLAVAVIVLGVMPAPVLRSMLRPVQALRTPATGIEPPSLASETPSGAGSASVASSPQAAE